MSDLDRSFAADDEPALTLVDIRQARAGQPPRATTGGYPAALLAELVAELRARPAWQRDALCREPDYAEVDFFPGRGGNSALKQAKDVCSRCLVAQECAAYAVQHHIKFGVWGGTSERERRPMRGERPMRKPGSMGATPGTGRRLTAAEIAEASRANTEDRTPMRVLAAQLGVHEVTLAKHLRRYRHVLAEERAA